MGTEIFMLSPVTRINFTDYTELIPAFLTIVLTCLTFNIGVGVTAGLLSYPMLKVLAGREREVAAGPMVAGGAVAACYLFYPYKGGQ